MTAVVLLLAARQCDGCGDEDEVQMELRVRCDPETSRERHHLLPPPNSHNELLSPSSDRGRATRPPSIHFFPAAAICVTIITCPPTTRPRRIENPDLRLCGSLEEGGAKEASHPLHEQIVDACIRREDERRFLVRPRGSKTYPAASLGAGVVEMLTLCGGRWPKEAASGAHHARAIAGPSSTRYR
ncbi:hypothetical protein BKA80DRAFT_19505 [Phyllosticta citrichinensis]